VTGEWSRKNQFGRCFMMVTMKVSLWML